MDYPRGPIHLMMAITVGGFEFVMSSRRPRRPTEIRLEKMDRASEAVVEGAELEVRCPRCQALLVASRNEVEGGTTTVFRCEACGYVYLKRN